MKGKSCCWFLLGLVGLANCITVDDFYPFNPQNDQRLPNGDSTSSHKIALSVPAKFYDTEYDYLWINTDGYISFEPDTDDIARSDFPFNEALLSPFMSDLDTTNQGEVYFRESNDVGVLTRATSDIRLAFPTIAADFDAESAFVVTWHGVEGRSIDRSVAKFTFQCIIVSNGRDTYAIFLYPEKKMGVVPAGVKLKSALFQARAGFNQGRAQFLEMYPVESLVDHRNTRRNGEWIFQIGGEGVRRSRDVRDPENARHVKRQTSIINVQEVDLDDEEDDADFLPPTDTRVHDYCSRDTEACIASNSQCVNHQNGYCCRCDSEYYGNGKVCVENKEPIRVNGNVTGVVDVRSADGSIQRLSITNVDFHSYVITSEGRAYTAVSGVNPILGRALQPISPIGEIVGWLFAVPTPPAVNGFQFTGGSFQRQVSIRFKNSDYRFDMRQRFLGIKEESNVNVVVAHTNFVGLLPEIAQGAVVKMPTYSENYTKKGAGRFASAAVRHYTVDDVSWQYDVSQTIIFNECSESLSSVPDELRLLVSGTFLNYHDDDNNVRYAMNDKITANTVGDPTNPCYTGEHNCNSATSVCEPVEGTPSDYRCRCRTGFVGDGTTCDDIDECLRSDCSNNAICTNTVGSFSCECIEGYVLNRRSQECESAAVDHCSRGTHDCGENAHCLVVSTPRGYDCRCNAGYEGDGYMCSEIGCPGNQVYSTCAGCFTTCEERFQPKICTTECRRQCTCPADTYIDGDMCVTADQCPSGDQCITDEDCGIGDCVVRGTSRFCQCPFGFTFKLGSCRDIDECLDSSLNNCADHHAECINSVGSFSCLCHRGFSGDGVTCDAICPGNQVYSTCAGCFVTCEERSQPKACTSQCRMQCTCPSNTYLDGDMCVTSDQCPSGEKKSQCEQEYEEVLELLQDNPGLANAGPELPTCLPDGRFNPKQCSKASLTCWCADPDTGRVIANTMIQGPQRNTLVCHEEPSGPCTARHNELVEWQRQHPNVADGPDYPECDEQGLYRPRQCNDMTRICWCVDPQDGSMKEGTLGSDNCDEQPSGPCTARYNELVEWQRQHPNVADGPDYPECDEQGLYRLRQCNDMTRICWCVDPQDGSMKAGTLGSDNCDEQPSGPCTARYNELVEWQRQHPNVADGPDYPECDEQGLYRPRQCNDMTRICWCVDPQVGSMIPGTEGSYTCDDATAIPLTSCQHAREQAHEEQNNRPDGTGAVFEPLCTQAGAYEPLQFHPDGYYMCVNINGREVSRHRNEPQCLSPCQLQAYYAETQNTLTGTTIFEPQCKDDGRYSSVQCEHSSRTCFCVDQNGEEVQGTRVVPTDFSDDSLNLLNCGQYYPSPQPSRPVQLVLANSRSVNVMDLPATADSRAKRFFDRAGRMAIGVAFDCSRQHIYWTDVATRAIYKAPVSNVDAVSVVVSGLRSPEGIAVDFITGNIFWTDSGTDKIEVANADGSNRAVLISTGLRNPRGIAVDPFGGKLYWTDWNRKNPRVMMANLDGNNAEVLVSEGVSLPNNIAIDPYFRKICFIDAALIKCMRMDGTDLREVWRNSAAGTPFGLAVDGNKIYYSNRIRSSVLPIQRVHVVDTLSLTSIPLAGPVGVHGNVFGLSMAYTECPVGYNFCSRANGGCSQLCLAVPNGRTCKCSDGDSTCVEQ